MQSTRQQILEYLQRQGQVTVKALGQQLGLTSTGIRQHLTVLERDGLIQAREARGRVGRPALVFTLTDKGRSLFPKRYDALAVALLDEVMESRGNEELQQLVRAVARHMAEPYLERVEGKDFRGRVETVVGIMREQGCQVDWEPHNGDFLIHEYACPYANVVKGYHAICTVDVEFIHRLTGGETRLVRSLVRGEPACSFRTHANGSAASVS